MLNYFLKSEKPEEQNVRTEQQKLKIFQNISDKIFSFNTIKKLQRVGGSFNYDISNISEMISKYISILQTDP